MALTKTSFTLIVCLLALFWAATNAISGELLMRDKAITSSKLGGEQRYLLYVSTDKPVYREGEPAYFRAVVLNAKDNTPIDKEHVQLHLQIKGPKGEVVFEGHSRLESSTGGLKWDIPAGTAGGEYVAQVNSPTLGLPTAERRFDIRAYRAPRLKTQIEFTRDGYGPGDTVQATLEVSRAEGGIPQGANITVMARIDGVEVFNQSGFKVDSDGLCYTEFSLPHTMDAGDGALSFIIEDGGVIETASKTLPILLQNLDIQFYPEGGELIADLENRVYLQALRPDGKPADIEGAIVAQGSDTSLASVKTQHEGRGLFSFTPQAGKHYVLKLSSPASIEKTFALPEVLNHGTTLQSTKNVFEYNEKIRLQIQSTREQNLTLTLHKRENTLSSTSFDIDQFTTQQIELNAKDAEGVLMATLWSENGNPLSERLLYRKPKFTIHIDIKPSKDRYVPGEKVALDINTTDENGRPVEAVVGLSVSDDSILEMIDKREQAPRLPVMVYLENEVKDLADAHVYLDNDNPESAQAVDLLLGTQGWRRFVLVDYAAILEQFGDSAKRILAENHPVSPPPMPVVRARGRVFDEVEVMALAAGAPPEMDAADALNDNDLEGVAEPLLAQVAKPVAAKILGERREQAALFEAEAIIADDFIAKREKAWMPSYFREYAHQVRANRKPNDRRDFTETLYWHAGIKTSARDGKAQVIFDLSDSVTSFRVIADAFGRNGALGSGENLIESVEPFYIEAKMPLSAMAGDLIELPVALINGTPEQLDGAKLVVRAEGLDIRQPKIIDLRPDERGRVLVRIKAETPGDYSINFNAAAGSYTDSVTRTLKILPKGFPISIAQGGLIEDGKEFSMNFKIPREVAPGSLLAIAKVYPSPLASMEEALNALLREPYGCFEQTSSTTYPLVMAQQYFMTHQGVAPEKIAKAKTLLEKGYERLIGFESEDKGYEWFGANPAHEALTAYGLMEFTDLSKVMSVDESMIQRTRNWLLSRRDGKGGFKRDEKALDSFGRAPEPTTNAYIVWSLLESGEPASNLKDEIAAVKKEAMSTKDSYVIALAANILYLVDDNDARKLAEKLKQATNKDGAVDSAETSITRSGGDALLIETTSLALLAWLKEDDHWAAQVEHSIKWLFERSKSGRFGSTQSTVLALKAINAYDQARAKPKHPGSVQLVIDGKPFGRPVHFDKDTKGAIELPDFAAKLSAGNHQLELHMADGSKMPFAVEIQYHTTLPPSSKAEITIATALSDSQVKEGESLELNVDVSVGSQDAPTPMAIIGLPAGLEVRHDQLKELVGADRISAYEVIGQDVVIYWRALKAESQFKLPLSLTATVPGEYTGPASRSYLYYTDEDKHWVEGLQVKITHR